MASNIIISFNNLLQLDDKLAIQDANTPSVLISITVKESDVLLSIDENISNTKNYLENRYNSTGRYTITPDYVNDTLTITDNIGGVSSFIVPLNESGGRLSTTINNDAVAPDFYITSIETSENATDPCNLVDLQITTSTQATNITSPVVDTVSTLSFSVNDVSRDYINLIDITVNDDFTTSSVEVFIPKLDSSLFDLESVTTPSGGSLNINWLGLREPLFDVKYSLNNTVFYSTSSFSGLSEGNYTLYIKDDIGCSTSIPFEITAFEANVYKREAYFTVSEQNSNIFVKNEVIDNISTFRNPTNTLSYQEDTAINLKDFKQVFQKKDGIITNQIKSNYNNVEVKLIDCDYDETILTLTKKTENLDITDIRDVTVNSYSYLGSEFIGVTYINGKIYDPITLDEVSSYYLGALIPSFMNIDDYIQIEGAGWYKVKDVVFINNTQTLILNVLSSNFDQSIISETVKGTSKYNKLPYEVYEFNYDLNSLEGDYYLTIDATDEDFEDVGYISEWFNVKDLQPFTYLLKYYNSVNNETNYSTGIRNKIRVKYEKTLDYLPSDTNENFDTDTNTVQIESTYRDLYTLTFDKVPLNMVRKIGLAISNDRIFINGLSLLKNGEIELERIGITNTYKGIVEFKRSDYTFISNAEDGSIVLPTGQVLGDDDNDETVLAIKD